MRKASRLHPVTGTPPFNLFNTIQTAVGAIARGDRVIVVDAEDRENEGDFICAADKVTPEIINFMRYHSDMTGQNGHGPPNPRKGVDRIMDPPSSTSDRRLPMRQAMRRATRLPMVSVLAVGALLGWLAGLGLPTATLAQDKPSPADPLPSWNEGPVKKAITDFVTKVTRAGGPDFVPDAERIAVFDNDGTLWSEQPIYFQLAFVLDRVKAMDPQHPEWKEQQPFKAVLEGDIQTALAGGEKAVEALMVATHAGMTTDEFDAAVLDWVKTARHPRFDRPYTDLVFQPMLEVLAYLWANGFKTYIVSGGGIDFMRPWTPKVYGILPEQIVGSCGKTEFELRDGKPALAKLAGIDFIDDGPGKPVGISRFIGRRPVMCFGNSDGDRQMLQWTSAGPGPRFGLIVHHTDADREWAYDRGSPVGKLEEALNEAPKAGWVVADMKADWKVIYPFQKEIAEIAIEAYVYAYPIVLMDISRQVMTNYETPDSTGKGAPINQFSHARKFPDDKFTDVVRPNADTLYSSLWFDVSQEPLVISVPDSGGRYYLLQMLDLWTDVFASPGKRTTGTGQQRFAIAGPKWQGKLPDGVELIRAPTAMGWILGRTQTNGTADYEAVHKFQKGLTATPLSAFGKPYTAPKGAVDPAVSPTPPVEQVEEMDAATFFTRFCEVTKDNPPHANDYPVLARLKRIGIEPGQSFDLDNASPAVKAAIPKALAKLKQYSSDKVVNGWMMVMNPIGTYGTDYLKRANIAYRGLGANCVEDAIYPSTSKLADGQRYDSGKKYTLHFTKEEIPPARAFWSLTMYNDAQFFAANPINRYAIGDRDYLKFNADGSLNLYVQRESPGEDKESNWLPAPKEGGFSMTLRVYWPKPEALDGTWNPPPVEEVK